MLHLCRARFIPPWKRNALWELVNNDTPKISRLRFWVVRNLPFVVCRIREEPLISAFKPCSAVMKRVHSCDTCEKQLEDM